MAKTKRAPDASVVSPSGPRKDSQSPRGCAVYGKYPAKRIRYRRSTLRTLAVGGKEYGMTLILPLRYRAEEHRPILGICLSLCVRRRPAAKQAVA